METVNAVRHCGGSSVEVSALILIGMARAIGIDIPPGREDDLRAELRRYRVVNNGAMGED